MFAASKSGRAAAAAPTPTTDATFAYVPLLLNTTSTNGQQNNTFLDSSTNAFTITRNGTPTQGSITPYWPNGQWSNYFNGGTTYLQTPSNSAVSAWSTDFTIESYIYLTSLSVTTSWWTNSTSNSDGFAYCYIKTSGAIALGRVGVNESASAAGVIKLNQWQHIAIVRNSSAVTIYVNGVSVASPTTANLETATAKPLTIGGQFQSSGDSNFNGFISNFRVVKGTAVYTANFTPPTAPLTATQSANVNGNPSAAITGTQTSLLTCQSNRFRDNSTNNFTITPNGTPRVQAFQPFSPTASYTTALYGGSGFFNGSSQLSIPNNVAFEIGAGNFSYEAFVYASTRTNTYGQGIISYSIAGSSGSAYCSLEISAAGFLQLVYAQGSAATLTDPTSFPINQWVHCVACRSGSTLSIFVNGLRQATTTTSATVGTGGAMVFAGQAIVNESARQLQNGYISNARVLKGASAYDATLSTLTVPTAPVTAIANTSLLLNMTNAGIYDAAAQNVITTVGDAQVSTTITAQWPPTSIRFDPTTGAATDSLTMPLTPATTITSGNFTIEFWLNPSTVASASQAIVGTRENDGVATINWGIFLQSNRLAFQAYSTTGVNMGTLSHQTTLSAGTWYYCALTRNGSTFTLYINSVPSTSTLTSALTIVQSGTTLYVGKFAAATSIGAFNGYIQDLRITKGVVRTITTPTAAFPTR
jgi:hypothetical protein